MTRRELERQIRSRAEREWADPSSLSRRNAASIPLGARPCLTLLADMSAVVVLDWRGDYRAFSHTGAKEVQPPEWAVERASEKLREWHAAIADAFEAAS